MRRCRLLQTSIRLEQGGRSLNALTILGWTLITAGGIAFTAAGLVFFKRLNISNMRSRYISADTGGEPAYFDIAARIMEHTWVGLLYTVACVVFVYLLGRAAGATILFAGLEVPTLALAIAVLFAHRRLRWRVPWYWILTSIIVWGYETRIEYLDAPEWMAVAIALLASSWLFRAIMGSVSDSNLESSSAISFLAHLLTLWGATLQVAFFVSALIKPLLADMLSKTQVGEVLLMALSLIGLTSPWHWFPVGLLGVGLVMHAALRFQEDRYIPKSYDQILVGTPPRLIATFVAALRVPIWICVVIIEFIAHFLKQLWISVVAFLDIWLARLTLITTAFVLPACLMMAGHASAFSAMNRLNQHLAQSTAEPLAGLWVFFIVHSLIILSLCAYVFATPLLALEVIPVSLYETPHVIWEYTRGSSLRGAGALGRSFSLFGIVCIAVPAASLLPGGPSAGIFSLMYIGMMILVVLCFWKR